MKYTLLIYSPETVWAAMPEAEAAKVMSEYMAYSQALRDAGKIVVGYELNTVSTAKTVAVRHGGSNVVDGPFAETKEQLGGFYLIEADTEADALAWAARCPGAKHGRIEVRPVIEH